MEFRPCIDLHDGKVKQIVGSTLGKQLVENFVATQDSTYFAKLFKEDGLKGGHIIMLGQGNEQAAIKALQAYPGGLQVGGGIHLDNANDYLEAGASHIIVTSYIFYNGLLDMDRLQALIDRVGKKRIVIDLSCRKCNDKWFVVTDKWTKISNFEVNAESIRQMENYCDEFLIHAVDVEGKRSGMQEELVHHLAQWVSIPTTYAGGVRSLEDLDKFKEISGGKLHVTIGSALDIFGGDLSYKEVVQYCRR